MNRDRKKFDDALGDAHYEAWRAGLNPDRVNPDRVQDSVDEGLDRFEAADREVSVLMRDSEARRLAQEADITRATEARP